MKQLGIEYVSLGVQSLHRKNLRLLGRDYHDQRAREAIAVLTEERFRLLTVDLVFAFPGESIRGLLEDLQEVAAYEPQQITCYPLFTFPYTAVGTYKRLRRQQFSIWAQIQKQMLNHGTTKVVNTSNNSTLDFCSPSMYISRHGRGFKLFPHITILSRYCY